MMTAAVAVVFRFCSSAGCGSEPTEIDKLANYTPETLAQELILRYRALNPEGKKSNRGPGVKLSEAAIAARDKANLKKKAQMTKKSPSATIDDLLEDIRFKITLIKGMSAAETTKKMMDTISSDSSLPAGEKKSLTVLVGRLAD